MPRARRSLAPLNDLPAHVEASNLHRPLDPTLVACPDCDLLQHVHGINTAFSGHAESVVPVEDASYAILVRARRAALRRGSESIALAVAELLETGR